MLQDPYWLLDTVQARLFAEAGAAHLEFEQLPLVAQEQVRLMEESIAETCLHLEPARRPVDWHCREEPEKTLSERSIEGLEEELTVDEEKELVCSNTPQHCLHTAALPTHAADCAGARRL